MRVCTPAPILRSLAAEGKGGTKQQETMTVSPMPPVDALRVMRHWWLVGECVR